MEGRGGAIVVGGFLAVAGLMVIAARSRPKLLPERAADILTARDGSLGAGLSWADVVAAPWSGGDNLPSAAQAGTLRALTWDALEPVTHLTGHAWTVCGGFRGPAADASAPTGACRLPGHRDGTAIDVRIDGVSDADAVRLLRQCQGQWTRAVLCGHGIHVERRPGADWRLAMIELPSGTVVPAGAL